MPFPTAVALSAVLESLPGPDMHPPINATRTIHAGPYFLTIESAPIAFAWDSAGLEVASRTGPANQIHPPHLD